MTDAEVERRIAADPDAGSIPAMSDEKITAKLQALRDAIREGLESGAPVPFDVQDIIAEAKAQKHATQR
jgi:Arc/MetJ-type ribon-helix-helix transcriptional regulator